MGGLGERGFSGSEFVRAEDERSGRLCGHVLWVRVKPAGAVGGNGKARVARAAGAPSTPSGGRGLPPRAARDPWLWLFALCWLARFFVPSFLPLPVRLVEGEVLTLRSEF